MSEFLEHAKRIAAENREAQQQERTREAQQRATEETERQISRQRAKDFANIMRQHNIAQIALCQEGDYYPVPILQRVKVRAEANWTQQELKRRQRRELQEAQGRKLSVVRMGWIAAQKYEIPAFSYDYTPEDVPGIFVSDTEETFLCDKEAVSRGTAYVRPFAYVHQQVGDTRPRPDERALASDDVVERIGQMLAQYGIED